MRRIRFRLAGLLAAPLALLFVLGVEAHHSFSAEFDVGRPVELQGTLTRVEWTNPHAWLHLEVRGVDGKLEHWAVEMLGVNTLVRSGMTPATVKPGDQLTVKGYGARDGSNTANANAVSRSDSGEALWSNSRERD